jgi:hypothetical protein
MVNFIDNQTSKIILVNYEKIKHIKWKKNKVSSNNWLEEKN